MSTRCVALIRGINVGRAKRVAMADLRALVEDLGYQDVKTVLNSGNVVFMASERAPTDSAARIQAGLADRLGVSARVTVLTAAEMDAVVEENPLLDIADQPSRLLAAVVMDPAGLRRLEPLVERDWSPEALGLGTRAAYLWCPDGLYAGSLMKAVDRALGDGMTARNWSTVTKLRALVRGERG